MKKSTDDNKAARESLLTFVEASYYDDDVTFNTIEINTPTQVGLGKNVLKALLTQTSLVLLKKKYKRMAPGSVP